VIAPSLELAAEKEAFAATRRQRWFGLDTRELILATEEPAWTDGQTAS
jgi:hypothetical protein